MGYTLLGSCCQQWVVGGQRREQKEETGAWGGRPNLWRLQATQKFRGQTSKCGSRVRSWGQTLGWRTQEDRGWAKCNVPVDHLGARAQKSRPRREQGLDQVHENRWVDCLLTAQTWLGYWSWDRSVCFLHLPPNQISEDSARIPWTSPRKKLLQK